MRRLLSFRCRACGYVNQEYGDIGIGEHLNAPCELCQSGPLQRIASFSFHRSMPEHFNNSTGSYVNNEREFKDQLKIKSEEASLRTGTPHNFVPVDLREKEALGVTDEGLDSTYKRMHDSGQQPLKTKTIITP